MLFCLCVTLDRDAPARRPHSAHGDRSSSRFFFFFSPEFTPRLDKTKAATPVMEPLFATAFGKKKKNNNHAASHSHHRRQARTP